MKKTLSAFQGSGLMARVLRSVSWLMVGYGGSQAIRLAANLVLTRLLFPEAFGLMTLVTVVVVGLGLFSDIGLGPAIAQNPRGDDPEFLNTAWTIQVGRGVLLFSAACLLAGPISGFYGEPDLARFIPIAAGSLLIAGLNPTRIETAHRHLLVGRLTVLDLASQVAGVAFMVIMAILTGSVMSLVLGTVVHATTKLLLTHWFLPGPKNRFQWERAAASDILHFGKWIFLSTALTFVIVQSDRAILGRYLSLEHLGIYNIGFFLGSFPLMLGQAATQKVLIPIYRDKPVRDNPGNWRAIRKMRVGLTIGVVGLLLVMALVGPPLVGFLYDDRYLMSGAIVTLVSIALIPQVIGMTYDPAALAAGDSQSYFVLTLARAIVQVATILVALSIYGLIGAVLALGLSAILVYPVLVWLAVRHRVWDPAHDLVAAAAAAGLSAGIVWLHWDRLAALTSL